MARWKVVKGGGQEAVVPSIQYGLAIECIRRGVYIDNAYRGLAKDAQKLLRSISEPTQAELYRLYKQGKGAPAWPPGFSKHEQKSPATGRDIPAWQNAWDVTDGAKAMRVLKRLGIRAHRPIDQESWHIEFLSPPTLAQRARWAVWRAARKARR